MVSFVCSTTVLGQEGNVIAKIGDTEITIAEFEKELRMYGKGGNFQEKLLTLTPEGKKEILEKMVREKVLLQAAMDSKTTLDEEAEDRVDHLYDLLTNWELPVLFNDSSATARSLREQDEEFGRKLSAKLISLVPGYPTPAQWQR